MRSLLTGRVLLPVVNCVRGENVRREFAFLRGSQKYSRDELHALRTLKLRELLQYVDRNCPYYGARFREYGLDPTTLNSVDELSRYPTLSKAELPALLEGTRCLRRNMRRLQVRKTAGSSGHPSVVIADGGTNARSLAARYRAFSWYGIQPGDKEIRFWGRPLRDGHWKHRLKSDVLNRLLVDSASLNPAAIAETVTRIGNARDAYVYGYSSMVMSFVENVEGREGFCEALRLKAAICTSETTTAFERRRISSVLRCPVAREYGCSETDIIAFECPQGSLHVVDENVIVEIDKSNANSEDYGEIIITDLNNFAMPLIRYRIGDLGALGAGVCGCGMNSHVLSDLLGRQMGQYVKVSGGRLIHSQVIAYAFEDIVAEGLAIDRFRVIQLDEANLELKILSRAAQGATQKLIEEAIRRKLTETLQDAAISFHFEFVDEGEFRAQDKKFSHFESRIS